MSKLTTINTWKGDFASTSLTGCIFPTHIVAKVYDKGTKADIKISMLFETFTNQSSEVFAVFNYDVLKAVCGGKEVEILPEKTSVALAEPSVNPVSLNFYGRSGLAFYSRISNKRVGFSRAFNSAMSFGDWGSNSGVLKQGRYAVVDIIGATLSS